MDLDGRADHTESVQEIGLDVEEAARKQADGSGYPTSQEYSVSKQQPATSATASLKHPPPQQAEESTTSNSSSENSTVASASAAAAAAATNSEVSVDEEHLKIVEEDREVKRAAAPSPLIENRRQDEEMELPPDEMTSSPPPQQSDYKSAEPESELSELEQQHQNVETEPAQEQAMGIEGGVQDSVDMFDPNSLIHDPTRGDELVQATLIRDVDDTSVASNEDNLQELVPPNSLARDNTTGAITVESDMAVVEAKPVEPAPTKTMSRKLICVIMGLLLLVIAALSVGFVVSAQRQGGSDSFNDTQGENESGLPSNATAVPTSIPSVLLSGGPTATPIPILQRMREQGGPLRCGVIPGPGLFFMNEEEGGEAYGFDASLCAAVAAAATGDPKNVEYNHILFKDILTSLHLGEIDIVSAGITHTMERQVFQSSAKAGFKFTVPYLYQGMQLAGEPSLVDCGDRGLEYIAACGDIRVCVVDQSTHQQMLSSFLPGQKLIGIDTRDNLRKSLADETCNVIAHEGYSLAESLVRAAGYAGEYKVGRTLFSKEPLAMVTALDDPEFSDFANSVVQALVVAEANNITQSTASTFGQSDAFGEEYKDMFRHAVAAGGNYGELYERYLEPYSHRQGLNMINYGNSTTTGLLYSHPFGSITTDEGRPGETLLGVKERGDLRCGVRSNRGSFAELEFDGTTGALLSARGLEIDYCRALAGSIFAADGDAVEFIQVTDQQEGFAKLAAGDLDVFAGASWSFQSDVRVPEVDEGFSFTQPYFYGGQNETVEEDNLSLATKQDDHLWSSFVYWIAAAIVQAEETGIQQGMSNSMPAIYLFGEEFHLMFQDAILTVGNYQEIYERNFMPWRKGRNLLNGNTGPQMYPMPGLMDSS